MEKRVVLAFVLSFFVFFVWGKYVSPPEKNLSKNTQVTENKQDIQTHQAVSPTKSLSQKPEKILKTQTATIVNNGIKADFSDIGASVLSIEDAAYRTSLPVTDIFGLSGWEETPFKIVQKEKGLVTFEASKDGIQTTKTFRVGNEKNIIFCDILVKNIGKSRVSFQKSFNMLTVDAELMNEGVEKSRDRNLLEYSVYDGNKVWRKTGAFKFSDKEYKQEQGSAKWFGFRNRYFCTIVQPEFPLDEYTFVPDGKNSLFMKASAGEEELAQGEEAHFSARIFFGPQNDIILKESGQDFEKIHVYFRNGFLNGIAFLIQNVIIFLHKIFPNWGVCIILASLMIYGAMFPLTAKSLLSMKKMQKLQPKITDLREKYQNNPQKLNQEIMKVYSENRINPLGGCLPLIFQMPIFIGLYQVLWRSVLFKGTGFLWIKDLSSPDRLLVFQQKYPIIGDELNILPLVMMVLMFIQQKMSSKNMQTGDPNQMAQQKMMMVFFPLFLGFIFYKFASGLSLYFTVFYCMSIFSQWFIGRASTGDA